MVTIFFIAAFAVIILWIISLQRQLVRKDELCKNSMSQIGVQQASRWDALTALAEMTKSYSEYEYKALTDIIAQRRPINNSSTAADANAQEDGLSKCLSRLFAVAEQYPDLKATEQYRTTMEAVNTYENQVRTSRMVYNDTVTSFNRTVRAFPNNLVAGLLGFDVKDYLNEAAGKESMPSMKI